ncbi:hypothetical protein WAI453_013589 [Rhynchosporium graminicola]
MSIQTWTSLLLFLAVIVAAIPMVQERDGCQVFTSSGSPSKTIINKIITTEILYFPVVINTFIYQNTNLKFAGGVTINVYNAPTQILTIATGTSTATNTAITTVLPGNINIFQTVNIIKFPVIISTFVQQNTIIQATGGINIIINNAPTFVLTTVTATSTILTTVTSTVTSSNIVPTSFLLAPVAETPGRKLRRQATQQFVAPNGTLVDQCSDAAIYTINNSQLISNGKIVSSNRGESSAIFQISLAIGDISTSFTITDRLTWSNPAFEGGLARFCSTTLSTFALFATNAKIDGCITQILSVIPASSCNRNNSEVISSSSPSSTQSSISLSSSSSALSSTLNTSTASSSSETSATSTTDSSPFTVPTISSVSTAASATPSSDPPSATSSESATSSSYFPSSTETPSTESTTSTKSNSYTPSSDLSSSTEITTSTELAISSSDLPSATESSPTKSATPIPDSNFISSTSTPKVSATTTASSSGASISSCIQKGNFRILKECYCRKGYDEYFDSEKAILFCISNVTCTFPGQVLDVDSNTCVCKADFIAQYTEAGLFCGPTAICTAPGQVRDVLRNICVCEAGHFRGYDAFGQMLCA